MAADMVHLVVWSKIFCFVHTFSDQFSSYACTPVLDNPSRMVERNPVFIICSMPVVELLLKKLKRSLKKKIFLKMLFNLK